MSWIKSLFSPVDSMTVEEAKTFMDQNKEGTYTLLDVRQPGEYEGEHIPGSQLIPLAELNDRKEEIDPEKPLLVY